MAGRPLFFATFLGAPAKDVASAVAAFALGSSNGFAGAALVVVVVVFVVVSKEPNIVVVVVVVVLTSVVAEPEEAALSC